MPDYLSCICRKSVSLQGMQFLFSWRVGGGVALGPVHPKAMPGSWQLPRSWVWRSRPQSCKAVSDRHPHAQWILWANMTCFWGGCWMSWSKRPCWRGHSLEMS